MNIDLVEKLVQMLQDSQAEELSVTAGDLEVKVRRGLEHEVAEIATHTDAEVAAEPGEGSPASEGDAEGIEPLAQITAGMVGIFHPAEGLKAGMRVEAHQVIGVIESMKLMNEVTSPEAGAVKDLLAEEGSPVEFGQTLVTLEREG